MRRTRRTVAPLYVAPDIRHGTGRTSSGTGRAARRDGQRAERTGANATGGKQAANVDGTGRTVAPSPEIGPDGTRHGPHVRRTSGTGRTFALVKLSARAGRADRFTPFTGDKRTRRVIGRTVAPLDVAPDIRHGTGRTASGTGRGARRDGQRAGQTGVNATGGEQAANVDGTGRTVAPVVRHGTGRAARRDGQRAGQTGRISRSLHHVYTFNYTTNHKSKANSNIVAHLGRATD